MIPLVSYASSKFRHRQMVLGGSALENGVVQETHAFSPDKVKQAGFSRTFPEIGFEERGSGFWEWKLFIIEQGCKLPTVSEEKMVEAIAEKIVLLATSPEIRQRLGDEARARIMNFYSADHYIRKIERAYVEAVAGTSH